MERAHFKHLTKTDLEPLLNHASNWGVLMDVDFGCFERIAIFSRGDSHQKRTRRRFLNLYRLEECHVDVFRCLILYPVNSATPATSSGMSTPIKAFYRIKLLGHPRNWT